MNYSLTDEDIRDLTDYEVPVLTYSELIDRGVLDSLLESPSHCIIFLVRQNQTYGHWVCLFLKLKGSEKGIHLYDSYGNVPDSKEWKKNVSDQLLVDLHQDEPYLLKELYDTGYNIFYNEYQHQDRKNNIATCGRHAVCRSCFTDLDTDQYNNMITSKGISPDELVLELTQQFI
jgi:hypothetical protein